MMVYGKSYTIIINFKELDDEEQWKKDLDRVCKKHEAVIARIH
jgi:hypothetical protein